MCEVVCCGAIESRSGVTLTDLLSIIVILLVVILVIVVIFAGCVSGAFPRLRVVFLIHPISREINAKNLLIVIEP